MLTICNTDTPLNLFFDNVNRKFCQLDLFSNLIPFIQTFIQRTFIFNQIDRNCPLYVVSRGNGG